MALSWTLLTIVCDIALILFEQFLKLFFMPAESHGRPAEDKTMEHAHWDSSFFIENSFAEAFNLFLRLIFETSSVIDEPYCHMLDLVVTKVKFKCWDAVFQNAATPFILSVIWSLLGHTML